MLQRTGLRVLIVLLCLSAVATPVIAAGPPGPPSRLAEAPFGFLGVLWHSLMNVFAPPANWAKSGSIMDPNGLTATACRGSVMDPDGCPGAGNQAGKDLGSLMDPDG
ncbi:MAG: hypothetical protein WAM82_04465 [Thermoanaerobaculia bacterium]